MNEKINGKTKTDEVVEEKEVFSLRFDFDAFGSVNFKVAAKGNIVPLQLLALSHWLEYEGKNALANQKVMAAQMLAEQQDQIVKPSDKIIVPGR